jgi:hypothetical protein
MMHDMMGMFQQPITHLQKDWPQPQPQPIIFQVVLSV